MTSPSLKSYVEKLNETCRRGLEGAAGICVSRTNYNVEVEHWLAKLLEAPNTDLTAIFHHFEVDASRLTRDLQHAMDDFKTGAARTPALSPAVVDLIRRAWVIASIEENARCIRSGHLLLAMLTDDASRMAMHGVSSEFTKIGAEKLREGLSAITARSEESQEAPSFGATSSEGPSGAASPGGGGALDKYTVDLTQQARDGKIDPVLGRDAEIRRIIDILMRRRQNNPILTGEAGVGKTAVVEGFAERVAAGDVPPSLKDIVIRTLDMGLLEAGAGVRGEFENRLKSVIEEVKQSPQPIILFIDEAHTLVGAGESSGGGDAANLLKPALARGELRTIAATTWAEYKKYFEKDAALARRFQVVKVEEPSEELCQEMMRGLVATLEKHHQVRILNEAVVDAVRLSHRYISGRQLPDKAVSLLDTAAARVAIGQSSTPPAIEDVERRIEQLERSIRILHREQLSGSDNDEAVEDARNALEESRAERASLQERWDRESKLVGEIRDLRSRLESEDDAPPTTSDESHDPPVEWTPPRHEMEHATQSEIDAATATMVAPGPTREEMLQSLETKTAALRELQGEAPLLQVCVDSQAVAEVVSAWTGIPVGRMVSDEIRTVLALKDEMAKRIVGQDAALEAIAERVRMSRADLTDPRRPTGVFLLVGPSGVGKTETAITLAELLYGGEQNMTTLNMSEYKEEHKVSLLMGSPPGYVGYGEGGVLTEAVRRRPYSVVLLDEMEKAHPGIQDVFYQVFDKGSMRDGEGRDIDFKNTLILMTSNAGSDRIMQLCADPDTAPDAEALTAAIHEEMLQTFKPAFLGRVTLVPYFPLSDEVLQNIARLQLAKIQDRVREHHHAELTYADDLPAAIAERCTEVDSGARNIDHILSGTMIPELSSEILARMADEQPIETIHVSIGKGGAFEFEFRSTAVSK